jgi:hypothetical protein
MDAARGCIADASRNLLPPFMANLRGFSVPRPFIPLSLPHYHRWTRPVRLSVTDPLALAPPVPRQVALAKTHGVSLEAAGGS